MGNCPTSLRRAVRWNEYDNAVEILDNAGEDAANLINDDYSGDCILDACTRQPGNVFYGAVINNRLKLIELFIDRGADAHTTGKYGETCLHAAARRNFIEAARLLVKQGCDVYATDDQGHQPIHTSAMTIYNTTTMIKFLLEEVGKKEDVNARDYTGRTALHEAAYIGNLEVTKTLISYGADVNGKSNTGKTPLHCAAHQPEAWQILIDAGADPQIADQHGRKPKLAQNPDTNSKA